MRGTSDFIKSNKVSSPGEKPDRGSPSHIDLLAQCDHLDNYNTGEQKTLPILVITVLRNQVGM